VACGAFETVGYKFEPGAGKQGYAATFQVTEVDPAFPVRFEDLGVPDPELDAVHYQYAACQRVPASTAAAIDGNGSTVSAAPSLIASFGMPNTTEVASSCAMVAALAGRHIERRDHRVQDGIHPAADITSGSPEIFGMFQTTPKAGVARR
jgi:hypothetical protein